MVKVETMNSNGYDHMGEPEAYKLFIGQVPKAWTEKELRPIFEPYGDIYDLTILHDKFTGQHKGCAFLIYYKKESALAAQKALHDKQKLPGMPNYMQVKPADSETKAEDRKLFVGMISKRATEEDLRIMFSPFGQIEELTILRNPDGTSKACAFIKFATRLQAQNAIKHMHNCKTMEGCSSPLVVKPADTEKDKIQKRMQSVASNIVAMGLNLQLQQGMQGQQLGLNNPFTQQLLQASGQADSSNVGKIGKMVTQAYQSGHPGSQNPPVSALLQALQASGAVNPGLSNVLPGLGLNSMPGAMGAMLAAAAMAGQQGPQSSQQQGSSSSGGAGASSLFSAPGGVGQQSGHPSLSASQSAASAYGAHGVNAMGGLSMQSLAGVNPLASSMGNPSSAAGGPNSNPYSSSDALQQAFAGLQQYAAAFPGAYAASFLPQQPQRSQQKEGPDGANLFIYHLPQEFGDADLMQTFMPFGNVLSAKVFVDKATGISKCFGFVSYDSPMSAQTAINTMNGFTVGTKRLKVQVKRAKDQARPY